MFITAVIAGRVYQSQRGRLQLICFFLPVWVGLGSNPAHHSWTFTCVFPDPHEKMRTIPRLQNLSAGHSLFLHCCKLFFLTSVLITADIWGCLQPLTLVPFTLSCQLEGVADWLSRIVVLQFSARKGLCAENSAGLLWGENFLGIGGQMSPTSDILECLWGKKIP